MSAASKFSIATRELLTTTSALFRNLIIATAEGKNPNVTFPFAEIKLPRGTHPHPPNTDLEEVRNSVTLKFIGAPGGAIVAHLFNDGTIKTSVTMHAENNQRREEQTRLLAEESKFPSLNQTALRNEAYMRKMARIRNARMQTTWSIIQKQLEKSNAEEEYNRFLQAQAQQRAQAA
ncbi:hypothetical protein MferCBS31731_007755 [Microsporum ferrugineum]